MIKYVVRHEVQDYELDPPGYRPPQWDVCEVDEDLENELYADEVLKDYKGKVSKIVKDALCAFFWEHGIPHEVEAEHRDAVEDALREMGYWLDGDENG